MNPARARNRTRGKLATRKRTAAALESNVITVAFARTDDAHNVTANPNTAKRRHRVNGGRASEPRTSERQARQGSVKIRRMRYVETSNARTPSLPGILHKRPLDPNRLY